jgi:hypothetical protein
MTFGYNHDSWQKTASLNSISACTHARNTLPARATADPVYHPESTRPRLPCTYCPQDLQTAAHQQAKTKEEDLPASPPSHPNQEAAKKSNANQNKLSKHTSTYFSSIYKRVPWASREKAAPHHTLLTRPLLHLAPNFSFFSKLYLPSWAARSFRYRCLGDLIGPRASVRRGVVVH